MKKEKIILMTILILILCQTNSSFAQDDLSVFDRHDGIIMERKLVIDFDESKIKFYYFKDSNEKVPLLIEKNDLYNIKGTDNGKYVLGIKFYNPLRVKFNFEETRVEDPSIAAINTFISKFPSDIINIKSKAEATENLGTNANVNLLRDEIINELLESPSITELQKQNIQINLPASYVISQWLYEFYSVLNPASVAADTSGYNALTLELNKIQSLDDYLYGEIKIGDKTKNLNDWILQVQDNMYKQVLKDKFIDELNKAITIKEALEQAKKNAEESLKNFTDLVTNKYDNRIKKFIKDNTTPGLLPEKFKKYSVAACTWISLTIDARKKNNDEALKKLAEYITTLENFGNGFGNENYKTLSTSQIKRKDGIIKQIDVSAVKLDKDGKELTDSKSNISFKVSRWNSTYPYISGGALFTNYSFPEYSFKVDSTGANVINASETKLRTNPAIFLNFVFKWKNEYLYPVFQVGISLINKGVMIPLGGGLSLSDRVTISGGVMPGFTKQLNDLKVGDSITSPSDLEKDLTYKLDNTFYFAINLNFSKF